MVEPRYRELLASWSGVDALWVHSAGSALRSVIPADGCADLIVRVDACGRVAATVVLPTAVAHPAQVADAETVVGVRLRPGYGMSAVARSAWLVDLATRACRHGADPVALEAIVGDVLEGEEPPALIREFLAFVRETGGRVGLSECRSFAHAERSLQRAARRWLGMSPKHFLRIARVRSAQRAVCGNAHLSAVAADFGFSDQAHLTREFRALLGRTPGEVRSVGKLQDPERPSATVRARPRRPTHAQP